MALSNLEHTIILDKALEAFTAAIAPANAFSVNASPDPAERGDKVKVLWVGDQPAAANFVPATGYTVQDKNAEGLDVPLDKHKFVSWGVNDTELSKMPHLALERFGRQKGFQLAKAVLQDVWAVVTLANYGAAPFIGAASTFDADAVADLELACDNADWPENERSLILKPAYRTALVKDNSLQGTLGVDESGVLSASRLDTVFNFRLHKSNLIPANAQHLVGFAVHPDAILIANRYLAPQEGNKYFAAQAATDPEAGWTIGFRDWYDENAGQRRKVIECVYGYLKGNGAALKRMQSEAIT